LHTDARRNAAVLGAKMVQFTDLSVKATKPPEAGNTYVWDSGLRGFGLRISSHGTKTFCVLIGSGRRQTIGRYPAVSLADARGEARRILAEKTLGKVKPVHVAFDDAKQQFLGERAKTLRPRTLADYKRLLGKYFPYGRTSIGSLTPRMILANLAKLSPAEKHHAFAVARAFFRFCVRHHILDRSPMENMEVPAGSPVRQRVLSSEELSAVYRAAMTGQSTFHRIITLCVLTGQRRGELAKMEWSWIHAASITIPAEVAKNHRKHTFPLGDIARSVLDAVPRFSTTYVFPAAREQVKGKPATVFNGWGKPKTAFDDELADQGFAVAPWTIHDLRRCVSSGMASLKVPQVVVEKLLNHVSGGSMSQIAQVYNQYQYFDEMTAAVQTWEAHLQTLLSNTESTNGAELSGLHHQRA
jgi:integrase